MAQSPSGPAGTAPVGEFTGTAGPERSGAARLAEGEGAVEIVAFEGPLDPIGVSFLAARIEEAGRHGSQLVLLQLSTPGGLSTDASALVEEIASSAVPVAVWVGPGVAEASSAGTAVFMAAHVRVVAPLAQIGSAEPRDLRRSSGGSGSVELSSLVLLHEPANAPGGERAMMAELTAAWLGQTGNESGSPRHLDAEEAVGAGIAHYVAPTLGDALVGLDGRRVHLTPDAHRVGAGFEQGSGAFDVVLRTARRVDTEDGAVTALLPSGEIRFHKLSFIQRVLHAAASPSIAYFLLLAGATLVALEMFTAGVGAIGAGGAVCIALGSFGLWTAGPNWPALLLFAAGFVLLGSDIQKGIRGPATLAGAACLAAGLVLPALAGPDPLRLPLWAVAGNFLLVLAGWRIGIVVMARSRYWAPAVDRTVFEGREVEVREPLKPSGTVRIGRGAYAARAAGPDMHRGDRGRVSGADGFELLVESAESADSDT